MQTTDISARIGVSKAHMAVAKNYSNPVMLGPPLCDELVTLIKHLYTEPYSHVLTPLANSAQSPNIP